MLYPLSYEGGMTNGNATGVELAAAERWGPLYSRINSAA